MVSPTSPPQSEIQFASPAQIVDPDVDLDNLGLGWQEFVIGEISAQEQQQIAFVHRLTFRCSGVRGATS
jgi:hypothetical protein